MPLTVPCLVPDSVLQQLKLQLWSRERPLLPRPAAHRTQCRGQSLTDVYPGSRNISHFTDHEPLNTQNHTPTGTSVGILATTAEATTSYI